MSDLQEIWSEVLNMMEIELTTVQFNTWMAPLKPLQMTEDELVLYAPNNFIKKMIVSKYIDNISYALEFLLSKKLKITITEPGDQAIEDLNIEKKTDSNGQQYFDINEEKQKQDTKEKSRNKYDTNNQLLNPKYTFDTFVKGKSNELALAASRAVAENPATQYNPLFIWGGAGLGKTHLMQAIAHEILKNDPNMKVSYISSEKFTNELIASIGNKSTTKNIEFRDKYRRIDVLLIDDIQFIAGKTGTQEEFFHTFNDLYTQNKQIIISSDRPPKEIKTLEERLISRFEWGLMTDIQMPDYETRVAILQAKLNQERKEMPMEVLEYIAMNIKSNIRELEGALLTVLAYSSLMKNKNIDINLAKDALKKVIAEKERKPVTLELIQEIVAVNYHLETTDLSSKSRAKQIAYPRQIAMYLCRQLTDLSLMKIANSFNRDHSTIMHGIDKITSDMGKDESLKKEIQDLITEIKNQ
ncbi:MAG: chromosomal replication initiator protein DnaA [Gallicola sp.]|nr:chromosomal replication initiator protein DnaA [Gallicola sp.]